MLLLAGALVRWGGYLLSGWVGTGTPARGHLKIFGRQGREGLCLPYTLLLCQTFMAFGLCPVMVGGVSAPRRWAGSCCSSPQLPPSVGLRRLAS